MSSEGKIKGSTQNENIFKDSIRREHLIRLNWSANWDWFVDLIRERKKAVDRYRKSGPKAITSPPAEVDGRSVLPFPVTTAQDYGWLSTKKEFELEIFGSYYPSTTKVASNTGDTSSSIFYSTSDL